jgi:hypothetical protein
MTYVPAPLNTSHVRISPDLRDLTERLAENVHDLWATARLKDGWSYGPQRDDKHKTHPCLIRYAELPESEKDYDRKTVLGTLEAILALGYTIKPSP